MREAWNNKEQEGGESSTGTARKGTKEALLTFLTTLSIGCGPVPSVEVRPPASPSPETFRFEQLTIADNDAVLATPEAKRLLELVEENPLGTAHLAAARIIFTMFRRVDGKLVPVVNEPRFTAGVRYAVEDKTGDEGLRVVLDNAMEEFETEGGVTVTKVENPSEADVVITFLYGSDEKDTSFSTDTFQRVRSPRGDEYLTLTGKEMTLSVPTREMLMSQGVPERIVGETQRSFTRAGAWHEGFHKFAGFSHSNKGEEKDHPNYLGDIMELPFSVGITPSFEVREPESAPFFALMRAQKQYLLSPDRNETT